MSSETKFEWSASVKDPHCLRIKAKISLYTIHILKSNEAPFIIKEKKM